MARYVHLDHIRFEALVRDGVYTCRDTQGSMHHTGEHVHSALADIAQDGVLLEGVTADDVRMLLAGMPVHLYRRNMLDALRKAAES